MNDKVLSDLNLADLLYDAITTISPAINQNLAEKLADGLCDRLLNEPRLPSSDLGLLHEIKSMTRISRALYELNGLGGTGIPQMPNRSLAQLADKLEAARTHLNGVIKSYEADRVKLYTLEHERRVVRGFFKDLFKEA